MSIAELARPDLRGLRPYEAAQQVEDTIRLNANEAPWSSRADRFRRPLNRYPEIRPRSLAAKLGAYFGCDPSRLLVTRGTSEAIDLLIRAFCRAGTDNIVTTAPTFSMYSHYATVQGAAHRTVETLPESGFRIDVDAILEACDEQTRLVFICSPNNPTGTLVSRPALAELLERRGDRSAVVVDEAYVEFSGEPSAVELLDRHSNLVVLRTLSKALAFAGARCGTVMGPEEVIRILNAIQAPYAMSTPVVECVEDALESSAIAEAQGRIAEIVAERERLMAAISTYRFVETVWPSAANFFLIRVDDGGAVMRRVRDAGILLRDFGASLPDCIRVTVGSAAENDRLIAAFAAVDGGDA
jgi:histidinol-phosphate aminotransferase